MKAKLKVTIPLLLLAGMIFSGFSRDYPDKLLKSNEALISSVKKSDTMSIVVGNRLTDSTGQITISNSEIRQLIIPTIAPLSGITFTTPEPVLMVTPITEYLLLKGNNSVGEVVRVAIQLLSSGRAITYEAHGSTVVHVCQHNAGCSNCEFIKMGNMITTCKCSAQNGNEVPRDSTCQDTITWLR